MYVALLVSFFNRCSISLILYDCDIYFCPYDLGALDQFTNRTIPSRGKLSV
jgi:hypothetical protein